jgi:hypothetical protein
LDGRKSFPFQKLLKKIGQFNIRQGRQERRTMNEIPQLASAILTLAFAAVMLVAGQTFIAHRSTHAFEPAVVKIAAVPLQDR